MSKGVKILLVIGGLIAMLGVCGVLIYVLLTQTIFNNVQNNNLTNTPTITTGITIVPSGNNTVTPSADVQVTPPNGWIAIDNTTQHYIAYRPNGWYYRIFSPNMETLGIDINQIPEASEWAGMMTITRLTASNNLGSYKAELEAGFTEVSQVISGRNWTIIEGKTVANELFDSQFVKYAYVTVSGKEYLAGIRSSQSNFGGQEGNFDIFVSIINFY